MNRVINLLISILLLLFIGCSHTIPGGLEDATAPVSQRGYQILGESEGSVSSTFVFGIQTSKPDMEIAIRKAIDKLGGDELVNVTWDHKSANYFLFSTYTFIVRGTVIKRTEEGMPITTTVKPRPVSEFGSSEPAFDGLNFALSYSRGIDGLSGLRLNFDLRNSKRLYYFYPQISYAKLTGKEKYTTSFGEFEYERTPIITIPITFNVGLNGSRIEALEQSLPSGLNPYANIGLGYYLTTFDFDEWRFDNFGFNLGLGVEYYFQPNLSIGGGFNRHQVLTGEFDYTYWDWSIGLTYLLAK